MLLPVKDDQPTFIRISESNRSELRLDKSADEIQITVYSCPLSQIDELIVKLQELKAETSKPITAPFPAASSKIIELVEHGEHPIMTSVLGPKPNPAAWYDKALNDMATKPEQTAIATSPKTHTPIVEAAPAMPQPKRGANIINVIGVQSKDWTRHGQKHSGKQDMNYNADIVKNKSIRVYGIGHTKVRYDKATGISTHYTPAFDLTFKVGDSAVHGSYNLVYTGKITAIGEKTVKIEQYGKTHQLDLHTFIMRNWDYDAEAIFKRNSEWSD